MTLIAALVLSSFVAAPIPKEKCQPAEEAKKGFQGEWKLVAFVDGDGKPTDPEELAEATLVVKGDRMELHFKGSDERLTFTLDPKTDPPSVDLTVTTQKKPYVLKSIYKLEKDELTICFGVYGEERPKLFASFPDGKVGLLIFERPVK